MARDKRPCVGNNWAAGEASREFDIPGTKSVIGFYSSKSILTTFINR